ncbi:MAG: flagellar hook-associated protein FlgK, partial [Desulfovibrio sp.]|nr:flagellar hook-associated protein FlgK [Desulfovibrio sp.]
VVKVQEEMDVSIAKTVERVNELSKSIAAINKKIGQTVIPNVTDPNGLYDQRDALVEELASLVNINTIDDGFGDYRVQLTTGQP